MYNVEKYIKKCILSCEEQDLSKEEYEIVAVNDGSPDNSLQIAQELASKYSNIRVISRPNGGLSAARNTGLDNIKGEYIFFVDSDDWIEKNCLGKIASILKSESPDVLCVCAANVIGNEIHRRMKYIDFLSVTGPESMFYYTSPCAPFQIVRKAFLEKNNIRFCEGIYHEDVEYTPRMRYLAERVLFLNDIIYYVYQNPNSITRTVNVKKVYDVITVVTPSLHDFIANNVEDKYKPVYCRIISSAINSVLSSNSPLSEKDKVQVNHILYENRYLYNYYCKSSLFRYKIEGCLFKIFPSNPMGVFKFLKKISS